MQEKEVVIPIRFPVSFGKVRNMEDGPAVTISIKTTLPIVLAYLSLTFKCFMLAIKSLWD